jgi:hypothetical protein
VQTIDPGTIDLTITTPSGETIRLALPTSTTVATVKRRVEADTGVLLTQLQLFLVEPANETSVFGSPSVDMSVDSELEEREERGELGELRNEEVLMALWETIGSRYQPLQAGGNEGEGGNARLQLQIAMVVAPLASPATACSFGTYHR